MCQTFWKEFYVATLAGMIAGALKLIWLMYTAA